eukprot:306963-Hanusia_phi.AAC.1
MIWTTKVAKLSSPTSESNTLTGRAPGDHAEPSKGDALRFAMVESVLDKVIALAQTVFDDPRSLKHKRE